MKPIWLHANHLAAIIAHLDSVLPEEGCGLIAGLQGKTTQVFPVENDLHSPTRFEMNPQGLFTALDAINANRWDLLATFHSHPGPHGPATLSLADRQITAYPDSAVLLFFRRERRWAYRAFRWQGQTPEENAVEIVT
jgi:proteasome lid subunit RPN8/RPN11